MEDTLTKAFEICEDLGWNVSDLGEKVELQKASSLGEDFFFVVNKENFIEEVIEYVDFCFVDAIQADLTALPEALKGKEVL